MNNVAWELRELEIKFERGGIWGGYASLQMSNLYMDIKLSNILFEIQSNP